MKLHVNSFIIHNAKVELYFKYNFIYDFLLLKYQLSLDDYNLLTRQGDKAE